MKGSRMPGKAPLLAAVGIAVAVTTVIGLEMSSASGASGPRSLGQAMSERHGHAAGDPIFMDKGRKGVDSDADGVNQGTKTQASKVKLGQAAAVTPDQLLSQGDRSGACTIGYGRGLQCLPTTPPSAGQMGMTVQQMPWTCAEVRTVLSRGIPLNKAGVDPAQLDGNHDGVACGPGDR
ncbi:excalibur calcium-binding domain-containing protein [Jatrophihabitans lederbergiae]|jgi:hypothetical protein|uniref:Excalibur calcium-binding domain-containing protein n=1 Tax=Jatrophihabitans lederbergiae TaxID=3075547 RepID=A0ABU2JH00_9ACTN|nr:excalibur calcium-binding domain-containing protein [Jatrophihabitans sp. DSM 44399]MDT0264265.1 excalibur calcium-binding domain-containing protein [Jatrophihabitans sp. DSM 44399]